VVAPERLQAANSLRAFAEAVAHIGGPALAGVLVIAVGAGWGLAVDAASFAASALLLASLAVVSPPSRATRRALADLRDGWRAFRSIDWLWRGVVTMALWNAAWGAYAVLGPVVAEKPAVWAAVSTAYGIGAVGGGLLLVRLRPRRPGLLFAVGLGWRAGRRWRSLSASQWAWRWPPRRSRAPAGSASTQPGRASSSARSRASRSRA